METTLTTLYEEMEAARKDLWGYFGRKDENGERAAIPPAVGQRWEDAMSAHFRAYCEAAFAAEIGDRLRGGDYEMVVVARNTDRPFPTTTLSSDGGPVDRTWHDGPDGSSDVFYEVFDQTGRVAHGWIDAHSRRITQTG